MDKDALCRHSQKLKALSVLVPNTVKFKTKNLLDKMHFIIIEIL